MKRENIMGQCIAEFIGTELLIFFRVGCFSALVVAGVQMGQWEISIVWGLGVAMAIYVTGGVYRDSPKPCSYSSTNYI